MMFILSLVLTFIVLPIIVGMLTAKLAPGYDKDPWVILTVGATLICALIFNLGFYNHLPWGLGENYGTGVVEGVVTESSYQGVFYKTYETNIVYDTENPQIVTVSSPDGSFFEDKIGKKVSVEYDKWLIAPRKFGASSKIVKSVTVIGEK